MDTVEKLGRLAAKAELEAMNPDLIPQERQMLKDLADRYREAQYDELVPRKVIKCLVN